VGDDEDYGFRRVQVNEEQEGAGQRQEPWHREGQAVGGQAVHEPPGWIQQAAVAVEGLSGCRTRSTRRYFCEGYGLLRLDLAQGVMGSPENRCIA
jgi:hypothetical protein